MFNVPSNIKQFAYDYAQSTFKECNMKMAYKMSKSHKQDAVKNKNFFEKMKYVKEELEALNIQYWLSSGSLLGLNNYFFNLLII